MIVLLLKDNFGNTTHAVAVTKNCIFDSNEKTSLPIVPGNKNWLDRCVSNLENVCSVIRYPKVVFLDPIVTTSFLIQRIFLSVAKTFNMSNEQEKKNEVIKYFKHTLPLLKHQNQKTYNYAKKEFSKFCRDPDNDVFLSCEIIENIGITICREKDDVDVVVLDDDRNMFCVCEHVGNVVVDQLRIDRYDDFRIKANDILTEVNRPTYFDEDTDMLMILQEHFDEFSKDWEFIRAEIVIFYKGKWCRNKLHWIEDSFTIETKENQMIFVPSKYHLFIMKMKKN